MAKHNVEMSDKEQARAVELAREVAVELARIGPDCDAQNTFPFEAVPLFKDSGLVGLPVSKDYGGMGGDIWTVARVSTELAKGDPACALAFNMHFCMVGMLTGILTKESMEQWWPRVARDKKLICGAFSEARAGITGLSDTRAVPRPGGGWSVTGTKTWATLCQAADIMTFNATLAADDGTLPTEVQGRLMNEAIFIIDTGGQGMTIKETWDAMGMRATGTHTVVFDELEMPQEALLGFFRMALFGQLEWPALTFAAVYHGLALKAYEEARQVLRTKSLGMTPLGAETHLRDLGYVQLGLGEIVMKNETTARVLESTCRRVLEGRDGEWDPEARIPMLQIAKVVSTENAIQVVNACMDLIGGQTYRRGHVLERLYRDARSGPFHPLSTRQALEHLGKVELGVMEQAPAG